ncbi:MAG: beta-lactamase family protein [Deltaproteobacteria bacterium]|jgi:CubicO group peptidase (beta-lactamase class C family)|nr:beta-lactamase family protein [Deltaproteobacteria bacterium]MDA8306106.1 serine hydrolase [Deltaproteobacteria bacterium]
MAEQIEIHGYCDRRFREVEERFARNFELGLEVGASFAATIDGEYVIDLWGGYANESGTVPWERDTITNVYSTTKVMTTLCVLILVDRGLLDLDAPVARYWPEFSRAGKGRIPVRWLLSHSSGLSGFGEVLPLEALYDWDRIVKLLERQQPWWEPGTRSGYHAVTFGYLLGELVRRVSGKSLGAFFRDEAAVPLGADFYIGLPVEHEGRVAEMTKLPQNLPGQIDPESIAGRTFFNPPLTPGHSDRAWRGAEIPASNGQGNARSVARIGSLLACGGRLEGRYFLSKATMRRAIEEQINGVDLVLGLPIRWGLGFGLANEKVPFLSPRSFYWGGLGGSWVEMDPDTRACFSYVMNRLQLNIAGDARMYSLRDAFFSGMKRV